MVNRGPLLIIVTGGLEPPCGSNIWREENGGSIPAHLIIMDRENQRFFQQNIFSIHVIVRRFNVNRPVNLSVGRIETAAESRERQSRKGNNMISRSRSAAMEELSGLEIS